MALIKGRIGPFQVWEEAVLGGKRGLKVGRVIDRVRPGVGRQKFVVIRETLFEVRRETVVNGAAIRIVRVHIAERNTVLQCSWITRCADPGALQHCSR